MAPLIGDGKNNRNKKMWKFAGRINRFQFETEADCKDLEFIVCIVYLVIIFNPTSDLRCLLYNNWSFHGILRFSSSAQDKWN